MFLAFSDPAHRPRPERNGWWWADPEAALGIAALAIREGKEAWEGEDAHGE